MLPFTNISIVYPAWVSHLFAENSLNLQLLKSGATCMQLMLKFFFFLPKQQLLLHLNTFLN